MNVRQKECRHSFSSEGANCLGERICVKCGIHAVDTFSDHDPCLKLPSTRSLRKEASLADKDKRIADLTAENKRLREALEDWLNFSIDVYTSDFPGMEWLINLQKKTSELIAQAALRGEEEEYDSDYEEG